MTGRLFLGMVLTAASAGTASAQDVLTISGAVTTRADGVPVPGAVVSLVGADVADTTDVNGRYTLLVPSSARGDRMLLRVDGLGLPPKIVEVEANGTSAIVDVALTLAFSQEVTVGSRVAGAETERAVPVDIITRSQIAASGYTETAEVIESIAPSFNFPRPSAAIAAARRTAPGSSGARSMRARGPRSTPTGSCR